MRRRHSPSTLAFGIALLFGLTAWGGIALTSASERIATIWFSNGILVAALLIQSRNTPVWPVLIAAGFASNLILNVLLGDSPLQALGIAASNSIEICVCAYALRGHLIRSADLLRLPVLTRFFGVAVLLAPTLASTVAAAAIHIEKGVPVLEVMKLWIPADALGMALVVPLVLALRPRELMAIRHNFWNRCGGPLLLLLIVTLSVFWQSRYPLLFLLLPPLLLLVFRMGFNGAALAVSVIAAVAITATLSGSGPFMLVAEASSAERIFTMQLLLGTLMATTYPVCAMLLTQRRLTEEAARHVAALSASQATVKDLNERMRLAANVAKVGFWSWEPLSGAIEWDVQMHQMFQIDASESALRYELVRARVHPQDIARVEAALAHVQDNGGEFDAEFRVVWPDGTQRHIRAYAMLQCEGTSSPRRFVGLNIDVTQLRRLDRMKSEFVAIVSHELRTPLTSIRGATGLLTNFTSLPAKAQQLIALANRNAERLALLVDDILDMEKIESGKMRFDLRFHDLGDLIEQALEANAGYAARYQVRIRLMGDAPRMELRVDATRFLQVMANLLSNACKFSQPGGTVEVSMIKGSDSARIAVRDYGPGIALEFQSKIFGRFNQADASDARAKTGSGLGLAISKALAEGMSGSISFITAQGLGTTFFAEFPAAREETFTGTESKIIALPLELR